MRDHIWVTEQPLDSTQVINWLKQQTDGVGALVTFTGMVRDLPDADLQIMELEHYPGMTERALDQIVAQARERWPLIAVWVVHRVGQMSLGDEVVQVGVSSAHRSAAFEASSFIMDYLKRDAPFWKREVTDKGSVWVEQKSTDLDAAERWSEQSDN